MEFSYSISKAQYLRGAKLGSKPLPFLFKLGFILVGFWFIVLVSLILLWLLVQLTSPSPAVLQVHGHRPAAIAWRPLVPVFVFSMGATALFAYRPIALRRAYRRDLDMKGAFTATITPESISIQSSSGASSQSGWREFKERRERSGLVVLIEQSEAVRTLNVARLTQPERDELCSILGAALPKKIAQSNWPIPEQLDRRFRVYPNAAAGSESPARRFDVSTFENALALVRFGGFRFGHFGSRGGGSGLLFLVGVVFAGALIWAITRPARNVSTTN
jgi:hypothetical protein